MRAKIAQFLLQVSLLLFSSSVKAFAEESGWPFFTGGARGDEDVRCFIYDLDRSQIIFGGATTSDDFGPTADQHGFLVSMDLDGQWKWGHFFYNVSYPVSSIDGCQMASALVREEATPEIAVAGMVSRDPYPQPVYMILNADDGSIKNFFFFEQNEEYDETTLPATPKYESVGAFTYFREQLFISFVKDGDMYLLGYKPESDRDYWV